MLSMISTLIEITIKFLSFLVRIFSLIFILTLALPYKYINKYIYSKKKEAINKPSSKTKKSNSQWLYFTPIVITLIIILLPISIKVFGTPQYNSYGEQTTIFQSLSKLENWYWTLAILGAYILGGIFHFIDLNKSQKYYDFFNSKDYSLHSLSNESIEMGQEKDYINLTPSKKKAPLLIERKALGKHLAIIGTTGSGKTETAKHFLKDQAKQKLPTIFMDGKGDPDLVNELREFAKGMGQKFYLFRIDKEKGSSVYNGLDGTPKQITDKLVYLFDLSNQKGTSDYFNSVAKEHLQALIKVLHLEKINIDILNMLENFEPDKVLQLAKKHKEHFLTTELKDIRNIDIKEIKGLKSKLKELYNNTRETMGAKGFTIEQALKENAFILFSLDSLSYQELSRAIGKFIVQDIKQSAKVNKDLNKNTLVMLDEFNVFADNNVVDILNKTRSYKYNLALLFQTLGDLSKISNDFMEQVMGNTNTKIIMKLRDNKTKDYIIKSFGTKLEQETSFSESENSSTTQRRLREVQIISMNTLNSMSIGSALVETTIQDKPFSTIKPIKVEMVKLPKGEND